MRTVRPFADGDMRGFALNPAQQRDYPSAWSPEAHARLLAKQGSGFTVRDEHGTVLLVGGIVEIDDSYGHAWAFVSAAAGPKLRWLTRKVRGHLDAVLPRHRRIELFARADFPQAARWAALLGFANEGTMACAASDGGDMVRFARVNRDFKHEAKWGLAA